MTRDEILQMTPEELRVEIALRKGWLARSSSSPSGPFWWTPPNENGHRKSSTSDVPPSWPASIADAWELVEEIGAAGASVQIVQIIHGEGRVSYAVAIVTPDEPFMDSYDSEGETAALALSSSWLLWKAGV